MTRKTIIASIFFGLISASVFAKSAIVLSGGGAKGAYEVGVWKALDEFNLTDDISVFSGTSVGALNSALFSCTTARTAEKVWLTRVSNETFLNPVDAYSKKLTDGIFASMAAQSESDIPMLGFFNSVLDSFSGNILESFFDIGGKFVDLFTSEHMTGYFSRDELESIIYKFCPLKKIKNDGKTVYAASLRKNHMISKMISGFESENVDYFCLNQQTSDTSVAKILLASSAFPGAYDTQTLNADIVLNGKSLGYDYEYLDGGFAAAGGRNTPVRPVMNHPEVKKVFIVYLLTSDKLDEDPPFPDEELEEYILSDKEFLAFAPSEPLGEMLDGTLNFDPAKIKYLIDLGYNDSKQILSEYGYLMPPVWAKYKNKVLKRIGR